MSRRKLATIPNTYATLLYFIFASYEFPNSSVSPLLLLIQIPFPSSPKKQLIWYVILLQKTFLKFLKNPFWTKEFAQIFYLKKGHHLV